MPYLIYRGPDLATTAVADACPPDWVVISQDAPSQELCGARLLIDASPHIPLSAMEIEQMASLEVISCASTGKSHIDVQFSQHKGIKVLGLDREPNFLKQITAAAEHTWALVLAVSRHLVPAVDSVRLGTWNRELFPGLMLSTLTLGVIGCGRVGGMVANYGKTFGMRVVAFDPFTPELPDEVARCENLADLLEESNIVTLHVPSGKATEGLANSKFFTVLCRKEPTVLINTSHGSVVDETALLQALESGSLTGAALDVLKGEPHTSTSALVEYAQLNSNLLITPHIGGYAPAALLMAVAQATKSGFAELEHQ